MYIPRPAKLLFTIDDGWNKFLEKYGDSVSSWTSLSVERMLACGTCAMGFRRYCCASSDCSHSRFFCQSCKSKACSSCGFKATEQWLAQQVHILPDCDWQHITFTMPHLLWPFLTITGRYLMLCFGQPLELCCSWLANRVSKLVFSVPCILMAGNSINIRMFMFPSLEGFG
ncbi:transposase zinc-binding domain-containing protein [Arsenophonus nasoniae]|uniref:Transposase zinc-binding domain-containing protein n=1 Tax=Arsenophonus nasoniae TaxID=638 RepID=A0ABY8NLJ4_9GAMM|nr:transposase zinc-binding domain-containing protein [Arsenophonus nasoniae]WGM05326.1 transposase zinc-binding domain-containing protein [Arsenophonus nasoniae]